MSECSTCQDRRLVGGFLPAPCPSCAGGVSAAQLSTATQRAREQEEEIARLREFISAKKPVTRLRTA